MQPVETTDLARIYDEHFDTVWNHLRRMGISGADRDDLAQEVFLVVHRRLDHYDRSRPMRPWLLGIAARVALHHWRSTRRTPIAPEAPVEETAAPADDDHAARLLLGSLLASLDPERRTIVLLRELEGFSAPEIAELIEVPLNTVYSRLRRAREDMTALAERWQRKEER